ncbi:MAG: hypothetical protein K0R51_1959 [Cytophagaceae bacterium]|jgi:hypothetical protein|nr:hypothetical protein [Cytophagaceae bacterium]
MNILPNIAQIKKKFLSKEAGVSLKGMHKKQFHTLAEQARQSTVRFTLEKKNVQIFKNEATAQTNFDRHYIYHPAWAARIVVDSKPAFHTDISSTLHFCSILSAVVPVKFYDYRPAALVLSDLSCDTADLTALPFENASLSSLSCMHTVEHIGLGRYGDPLDYDGDLKAMKELARVLAIGGNLLFVVPVGNASAIHFNGHRVYHPDAIKQAFKSQGLVLKEFVLIPEDAVDGGLVENPDERLIAKQSYACGCFWYTK